MPSFKKTLLLSSLMVLLSVLPCFGQQTPNRAQDGIPLCYRSATDLTEALRRGDIKSLDLLNLYLERIDRFNKDINAVVALDAAAARSWAASADKALAQGRVWGSSSRTANDGERCL